MNPSDAPIDLFERHDWQTICEWVRPNSRVIDLGCGSGKLLLSLQAQKDVHGYGIEREILDVTACIENGVNVIQTNLNDGLHHFDANHFDYVILSLTLQAIKNPKHLLEEMMRIGDEGIVTFPNFGYWKNRLQILLRGKMPVGSELPWQWYDTPNIHLCTIKDFRNLCDELNYEVVSFKAVNTRSPKHFGLRHLPNLFGEIALFRFRKKYQ